MISIKPRASFAAIVIGIACAPASAVLVAGSDTTYTTAPSGLAAWNNVGERGVGGGVYLGDGWVLTAAHVGPGDIALGGTTYHSDGAPGVRLYEPDGNGALTPTTTDLVMYRLAITPAGLSPVTISASPAALGTAVTMVGFGNMQLATPAFYGVSKATDADGNPQWTWTQHTSQQTGDLVGHTLASGKAKRWGTATLAGFSYLGTTYDDAEFDTFDGGLVDYMATVYSGADGVAQAIGGDSGGAVFGPDGSLIGLMHAISNFPNQPANTVFDDGSSTVDIVGNSIVDQATFLTNLSTYDAQIQSVLRTGAVPEPGALLPATVAIMGLARRRR